MMNKSFLFNVILLFIPTTLYTMEPASEDGKPLQNRKEPPPSINTFYWACLGTYSVEDAKRSLEACRNSNLRCDINKGLFDAVSKNNIPMVDFLLQEGAKVYASQVSTVLHKASEQGHSEIVERLLNAKAQTDIQNADGQTPLHLATLHKHFPVVEQLITAGSPLNTQDNKGKTFLHYLAQNKKCGTKLINFLQNYDIDVNVCDENNRTPLHEAAGYGRSKMVTFLLQKGAQANAYTKDHGLSPLHCAVMHNKLKNVQCLMAANASLVHTPNKKDYTPLQWAIKHWCTKQQDNSWYTTEKQPEKRLRRHKKHAQIINLLKDHAQLRDTYYLDGDSLILVYVTYAYKDHVFCIEK